MWAITWFFCSAHFIFLWRSSGVVLFQCSGYWIPETVSLDHSGLHFTEIWSSSQTWAGLISRQWSGSWWTLSRVFRAGWFCVFQEIFIKNFTLSFVTEHQRVVTLLLIRHAYFSLRNTVECKKFASSLGGRFFDWN